MIVHNSNCTVLFCSRGTVRYLLIFPWLKNLNLNLNIDSYILISISFGEKRIFGYTYLLGWTIWMNVWFFACSFRFLKERLFVVFQVFHLVYYFHRSSALSRHIFLKNYSSLKFLSFLIFYLSTVCHKHVSHTVELVYTWMFFVTGLRNSAASLTNYRSLSNQKH